MNKYLITNLPSPALNNLGNKIGWHRGRGVWPSGYDMVRKPVSHRNAWVGLWILTSALSQSRPREAAVTAPSPGPCRSGAQLLCVSLQAGLGLGLGLGTGEVSQWTGALCPCTSQLSKF